MISSVELFMWNGIPVQIKSYGGKFGYRHHIIHCELKINNKILTGNPSGP